MAIAHTLESYMTRKGISYEVIPHQRSHNSMETAEMARIPGDRLAKAVLLEDENGYLMAVLPSTHRLEMGALHRTLNRKLGLATEHEIASVFRDCDVGAIPPLGAAYGIEMVWDDSLAEQSDVYFEGGSHEDLIHLRGEQFRGLMSYARHGRFSRHI
ncbi:MAG: YbaK/EbsC family protein [Gammaproteobacteria bacterium]|nr:YbaK/EbsC family protein [Gammaproteobacteria bacterium]